MCTDKVYYMRYGNWYFLENDMKDLYKDHTTTDTIK
jgi:hypothetical protein